MVSLLMAPGAGVGAGANGAGSEDHGSSIGSRSSDVRKQKVDEGDSESSFSKLLELMDDHETKEQQYMRELAMGVANELGEQLTKQLGGQLAEYLCDQVKASAHRLMIEAKDRVFRTKSNKEEHEWTEPERGEGRWNGNRHAGQCIGDQRKKHIPPEETSNKENAWIDKGVGDRRDSISPQLRREMCTIGDFVVQQIRTVSYRSAKKGAGKALRKGSDSPCQPEGGKKYTSDGGDEKPKPVINVISSSDSDDDNVTPVVNILPKSALKFDDLQNETSAHAKGKLDSDFADHKEMEDPWEHSTPVVRVVQTHDAIMGDPNCTEIPRGSPLVLQGLRKQRKACANRLPKGGGTKYYGNVSDNGKGKNIAEEEVVGNKRMRGAPPSDSDPESRHGNGGRRRQLHVNCACFWLQHTFWA